MNKQLSTSFFKTDYLCCNYIFICNNFHSTFLYFLLYFNIRLGGPDPLDYISMYNNPGDRMIGIPPHWHYIR